MPDDRTIDFVVMFLTFGLLGLGLLSMLVGRLVTWWDMVRGVNHSQIVMSSIQEDDSADDADRPTDRPSVSAVDPWVERLEVDRSKTAVIEVLVYSGWTTGEIRAVLKGDNGAIGQEVDAARQRLGIDPPEREARISVGSSCQEGQN